MQREKIIEIINQVLAKQGHPPVSDNSVTMREAKFRSLDFSETALRIEIACERELSFEAAIMRRIKTIKDVVDFFEGVTNDNASI